jgi:hypothetical protein
MVVPSRGPHPCGFQGTRSQGRQGVFRWGFEGVASGEKWKEEVGSGDRCRVLMSYSLTAAGRKPNLTKYGSASFP